jgi:hypothetical protein
VKFCWWCILMVFSVFKCLFSFIFHLVWNSTSSLTSVV